MTSRFVSPGEPFLFILLYQNTSILQENMETCLKRIVFVNIELKMVDSVCTTRYEISEFHID